ncbi:hypothetical protein FOZ61_002888, partial [Perkinsus olseni]
SEEGEKSEEGEGGTTVINEVLMEPVTGAIGGPIHDRVCSLQLKIPPELTVLCDLISSSDPSKRQVDVTAICDPGAGRSYWISSDDCETTFPTEPTNRWVELADGSKCAINRKIRVHVSLKKPEAATVGPVEFLVLPYEQSRLGGSYRLLIGRDLGGYLGLQLDLGKGLVSVGDGRTEEHRGALSDSQSGDECDLLRYLGVDAPGVVAQPEPIASDTHLVPELTEELQQVSERVIGEVASSGTIKSPELPGYRLYARELAAGDIRDCAQQRAAIFVELPPVTGSVPRVQRYAHSLYTKLSSEHQATYGKLIDDFVQRQWWWSERDIPDSVKSRQRLPESPCFLTQLTRKPRLVVDCRVVNAALGRASSLKIKVTAQLLSIRADGSCCLLTADVQQAFYRCRVTNYLIPLLTAVGLFFSLRVIFGLNGGAGILQLGLGEIVEKAVRSFASLEWVQKAFCSHLYMDDWTAHGSDLRTVLHLFALTIFCMLLFGFASQLAK